MMPKYWALTEKEKHEIKKKTELKEKHYEIIKYLVKMEYDRQKNAGFTFQDKVNFFSRNPKIKNAFIASLWELFHDSMIPFEVKKEYDDSHLETAMKKIIGEISC